MTDIEFLKVKAEEAVFIALHDDYDDKASAAVKAWAKAAGITKTAAWLTLIRDDREYVQTVINDLRAERSRSPEFSGMTFREVEDLLNLVDAEYRKRSFEIEVAASQAAVAARTNTRNSLEKMTGAELEAEDLA